MWEVLFALGLFVVVPAFIARVLVRGQWRTIIKAFTIWTALLLGSFQIMTGSFEQAMAWATVDGMFLTIVAVPALTLFFRVSTRCRSATSAGAQGQPDLTP